MERNRKTAKLAAVTLVAGLAVAGCGGGSSKSPNKDVKAAKAGNTTVRIHTFAFMPNPIQIKTGTTVLWTNDDQILHTVTAGKRDYDPIDSGKVVAEHKTGVFDAPLDGAGKTFSFTFKTAGTFHYFCSRHPGMEADVTVS